MELLMELEGSVAAMGRWTMNSAPGTRAGSAIRCGPVSAGDTHGDGQAKAGAETRVVRRARRCAAGFRARSPARRRSPRWQLRRPTGRRRICRPGKAPGGILEEAHQGAERALRPHQHSSGTFITHLESDALLSNGGLDRRCGIGQQFAHRDDVAAYALAAANSKTSWIRRSSRRNWPGALSANARGPRRPGQAAPDCLYKKQGPLPGVRN